MGISLACLIYSRVSLSERLFRGDKKKRRTSAEPFWPAQSTTALCSALFVLQAYFSGVFRRIFSTAFACANSAGCGGQKSVAHRATHTVHPGDGRFHCNFSL